MNKSGFILPILILITLIMLGVAGYLYLKIPEIDKVGFIRQQLENKVSRKMNADDLVERPAEVAITKNGFVPSTITIVAGQRITFVNQDASAHRVIPYPRANRNSMPELDSGNLQPTDSFTYAFENIGTFTINNNINLEKFNATVIVN